MEISVYIPTRGRAHLVVRAIRSVLEQSLRPKEIIVVVDGPDAKTMTALAHGSLGPLVHVIPQARQTGACEARNTAIRAAAGDFITGLDDDDEFLPRHLEGLASALDATRSAFACTTNLIRRRKGDTVRHKFSGEVTLGMLACENVIGNQVLTRTSYLKDLGGFDSSMPAWQDYDLWIRLCERFGSGTRIDARSYIQHVEHGGERITSGDRIADAHERFARKHAHLLDDRARVSLELLKHATSHQRLDVRQIARCLGAGFYRRTLSAIVSDYLPILRGPARRLF